MKPSLKTLLLKMEETPVSNNSSSSDKETDLSTITVENKAKLSEISLSTKLLKTKKVISLLEDCKISMEKILENSKEEFLN